MKHSIWIYLKFRNLAIRYCDDGWQQTTDDECITQSYRNLTFSLARRKIGQHVAPLNIHPLFWLRLQNLKFWTSANDGERRWNLARFGLGALMATYCIMSKVFPLQPAQLSLAMNIRIVVQNFKFQVRIIEQIVDRSVGYAVLLVNESYGRRTWN